VKHAIINASTHTEITAPLLTAIADAIERQLCECYAPLHQSAGASVILGAVGTDFDPDTNVIAVLDDSDQAGALGYHSVQPNGRPFTRVFVNPILANGGTLTRGALALSVTISHEALEATHNPYTLNWSDGPSGRQYACEIGDPVESDFYEIDNIAVSNFVGPRWFSDATGPYDWLGNLTAPWTMSKGGYLIVREPGGDPTSVFGEEFPEWKKPLKQRIHRMRGHAVA
jgi:hypothetical protein